LQTYRDTSQAITEDCAHDHAFDIINLRIVWSDIPSSLSDTSAEQNVTSINVLSAGGINIT